MKQRLLSSWRVIAGWALILVGVVLLALGWYGVSGTPDVARELSCLVSGGIGGLLTGVVGVGLLVSSDLRADRDRLGRVEAAMLEVRDVVLAERAERLASQNGSASEASRPARASRSRASKAE